jgi:hypothetical protein
LSAHVYDFNKQEIRYLGGRMDLAADRWYIPFGMEIGFFQRWLPDGLPLNVPFEEKIDAHELGAWWDPGLKMWYVPRWHKNPDAFRQWHRLPSRRSEE